MKILQRSSLIAAAAVLIGSTAFAQYGQPDPYDRGYRQDGYQGGYRQAAPDYRTNQGYYREERNEYRDNGLGLIRSVEADLQRVASYGYRSGRGRGDFAQALRALEHFDQDLSRGEFDNRALDQAIHELNEAANANHDYRQREILMVDVNRLREFRARGGAYTGAYQARPYEGYGYRY